MRPPPPPPPGRPPYSHHHAYHRPRPSSYHGRPTRPHHPRPYQQRPPVTVAPPPPPPSSEPSKTAIISAEPQLRDLQKELVAFVPAALRKKQAQAKKTESLPKNARPSNINLAPDVE